MHLHEFIWMTPVLYALHCCWTEERERKTVRIFIIPLLCGVLALSTNFLQKFWQKGVYECVSVPCTYAVTITSNASRKTEICVHKFVDAMRCEMSVYELYKHWKKRFSAKQMKSTCALSTTVTTMHKHTKNTVTSINAIRLHCHTYTRTYTASRAQNKN